MNRFFSSAMRIQRDRGQHVITTGPYQYVRHPGYAAFILVALCSGLALGSWGSLLPSLLYIGLFIRRTAVEDRLLREELEGYPAYAERYATVSCPVSGDHRSTAQSHAARQAPSGHHHLFSAPC